MMCGVTMKDSWSSSWSWLVFLSRFLQANLRAEAHEIKRNPNAIAILLAVLSYSALSHAERHNLRRGPKADAAFARELATATPTFEGSPGTACHVDDDCYTNFDTYYAIWLTQQMRRAWHLKWWTNAWGTNTMTSWKPIVLKFVKHCAPRRMIALWHRVPKRWEMLQVVEA
jgi:hypothetical protein